MECPVCMGETKVSCNPCGHPLCLQCGNRWLKKSPTCPLCKEVVVGRFPRTEHSTVQVSNQIRSMDFNRKKHAGITVMNHSYGVIVTRIERRDAAFQSRLRKGDVITHVNGIPVIDADQAIRIIERAAELTMHLECSLHVSTNAKDRMRWLFSLMERRCKTQPLSNRDCI